MKATRSKVVLKRFMALWLLVRPQASRSLPSVAQNLCVGRKMRNERGHFLTVKMAEKNQRRRKDWGGRMREWSVVSFGNQRLGNGRKERKTTKRLGGWRCERV